MCKCVLLASPFKSSWAAVAGSVALFTHCQAIQLSVLLNLKNASKNKVVFFCLNGANYFYTYAQIREYLHIGIAILFNWSTNARWHIICLFVCIELQEPHIWLVPTLEKAVVQFLATSVVPLAESQTLQSVVWVLWGQSTVTMAEMLQWDVNVRNSSAATAAILLENVSWINVASLSLSCSSSLPWSHCHNRSPWGPISPWFHCDTPV